jgi:hypothetical protein
VTSLCRNNEDGKCGHEAVAQLSMTVGDELAFDVCLTHLLKVMIRHGVTPQKAVEIIATVARRIATDILDEERQTQ